MSNQNSPVGFRDAGIVVGAGTTFAIAKGPMAYNASACYWGDALINSSGKLAVATATGNTGAAIAGIAVWFSWQSIAQNKFVRQPYYPGSDSVGNADVECHYISDPNTLLIVQSSGTAITQANVGEYANFTTGTPNTSTGASGMSLDQTTLNATQGVLPFQILGLPVAPLQNTDVTSSYNLVYVKIATQSLSGIN
jgi:hypothetical protein